MNKAGIIFTSIFILIFSKGFAQTVTGYLSIKTATTALGCGCTGCNDAAYSGSVTYPDPNGACGTTEPSGNSGGCSTVSKIADFSIPAGCTVNVNACMGDRTSCSGSTQGPGLDSGDSFRIFGTGGSPNGDSGTITGASNSNSCASIVQVGGVLTFSLTANRVAELLTYTIVYSGPACTPTLLPVELTHFNVKLNADEVIFEWETYGENKLQGFELQNAADAFSFYTFNSTASKGKLNEKTNYKVVSPNNFETNQNYFRLKMINEDGSFAYSQIIYLDLDFKSMFQLGPNPVINGELNILSQFIPHHSLQYDIYDFTGKETQKGQITSSIQKISLNELRRGVYFIRIYSGGRSFLEKLIIP
ncbi:MAG: T9SS type A sorting domain-containing protein [Sphingobacteriaceae bacterium]|nr:T9SS type A sorting domain-containing protein [Sphingobacteriaceae bacterium]